jgi:hypothetical protein
VQLWIIMAKNILKNWIWGKKFLWPYRFRAMMYLKWYSM